MVGIYQILTRYFCFFFFAAAIYMYLAARATGACVTHLPEVILLIAHQDAVFRNKLSPVVEGFLIEGQPFGFVALKNSNV